MLTVRAGYWRTPEFSLPSRALGILCAVTNDAIIGETTYMEGMPVVLLESVWQQKVLPEHIELASYMKEVLRAVRFPAHVEVDPVYPERRRCFARDVGPSRWLLVVVSYEQTPARVISAFGHRKDPPTWEA